MMFFFFFYLPSPSSLFFFSPASSILKDGRERKKEVKNEKRKKKLGREVQEKEKSSFTVMYHVSQQTLRLTGLSQFALRMGSGEKRRKNKRQIDSILLRWKLVSTIFQPPCPDFFRLEKHCQDSSPTGISVEKLTKRASYVRSVSKYAFQKGDRLIAWLVRTLCF